MLAVLDRQSGCALPDLIEGSLPSWARNFNLLEWAASLAYTCWVWLIYAT